MTPYTMTQDAQLLADIREDYAHEYNKEACDACEDCGPMMMCSFHSLLSVIFRGCPTVSELERERREVAGLKNTLKLKTVQIAEGGMVTRTYEIPDYIKDAIAKQIERGIESRSND